jgi:hypothetical protein
LNPLQYPPDISQEVKMAKERLSMRKICANYQIMR